MNWSGNGELAGKALQMCVYCNFDFGVSVVDLASECMLRSSLAI